MPAFSNRLPKDKEHMGFKIVRTPESGMICGIITTPELLVCDTHFWGGRTIPCERLRTKMDGTFEPGDCAACREAVPYRTHVYVACFSPKTGEHFIFECTAAAAQPLEEYWDKTGTLRGCVIKAIRSRNQRNAKVMIETGTANIARQPIPDAPRMDLLLSVIWRLPLTGLAIEDQRGREPTLKTKREPINRMREQPDNAAEPPTISDILRPKGNGHKQQIPSS